MQIALTKKLADAMAIKPPQYDETINPLFSWTANWAKIWSNSRTPDMLVLVNNATRLTVAIYEVKKRHLKKVDQMMIKAIENTLLELGINPEMVSEYLRLAGEVDFVKNSSRQRTAWVNSHGQESGHYVAQEYNGVAKMYNDTIGTFSSRLHFKLPNSKEYTRPDREMKKALAELTGLPVYRYRAFELMATLDLGVYQARRRIIVPANIRFERLHRILQRVFRWSNYHMFDFSILDNQTKERAAVLVTSPEDLSYIPNAILIDNVKLDDYFPEYREMVYTYDYGDNWEHHIELLQVIDNYLEESPYLVEATGQTPPEDVGGVPGFIQFREIMMDPDHPAHDQAVEWAGYWSVELSEYASEPRVIDL